MPSSNRPKRETLRGRSILLVEDDFVLLLDLETALRDAGAGPIHTCRSVGEANAVLDKGEVAAAILDIRIGRETIAPVARKLAERGTPFFFYTGQIGGDRIIAAWQDHPVLSKPERPDLIVKKLSDLLNQGPVLPRTA